MNLVSFPRYAYIQTSQPAGVALGSIWVDTDASPITSYLFNGSTWVSNAVDVGWVAKAIAQQSINILINSVAATSTLNDYDQIFVDDFTDADGTSDTIDTGNTTAIFSTDKYVNTSETPTGGTTEDNPEAPVDTDNGTGKVGMKVQFANTHSSLKVTKETSTNATKCYIQGSINGDVLATADFASHTAQFSGLSLSATTDYWIYVDADGGSFTFDRKVSGATLPTDTGEVNWISGCAAPAIDSGTRMFAIDAITYGQTFPNSDLIIQTNAITIPSGITYHQLYAKNSLAGTGSITYNISADNGVSWDEDQVLNTKNAFASSTGTTCLIKINLNGTGSGNTSQASNYGIIIYT